MIINGFTIRKVGMAWAVYKPDVDKAHGALVGLCRTKQDAIALATLGF